MPDISTLIFAKDGIPDLINLVKDVYPFSSEVVIVDSSTPTNKRQLLQQLDEQKLNRVRVFPVVALGHPEPYQMYGLDKCRAEWIFYIDTDEGICDAFKNDIHRIVKEADVDGFKVRKRELSGSGHRYFDSYQRRLYRKNAAIYSGLCFFDPEIRGTERKLSRNYYLNHRFDYYENLAKSTNRYFKIMAFESRITYGDMAKILNNKPILKRLFQLYVKINKINTEEELTPTDYKRILCTASYLTGDILYYIKRGQIPNLNFTIHNYFYLLREFNALSHYTPEARKEQLDITHEIKAEKGVINYLRVDEQKIDSWRQQYDRDDLDGTRLFITLITEEHRRRIQAKNISK
jgi:hypothetical protein